MRRSLVLLVLSVVVAASGCAKKTTAPVTDGGGGGTPGGAVTALIATAGFRDVIEIARELRYDLYDLTAPGPDPVIPRHLRFEVEERVDAAGAVVKVEAVERRELPTWIARRLAAQGQRVAEGEAG